MAQVYDISEIVARLEDNILSLARHLFKAGIKEGMEYRIGSLAGEKGRSMAIHVGSGRPGVWSDFSSGAKGDALDLIAAALFRGDKKQAVQWAKSWLGLDDGDASKMKTSRLKTRKKRQNHKEGSNRNKKKAFALWLSAQERLRGTPADLYLKGRGIDLARLGRQPRALRFHPSLDNWEGLDPRKDQPRRLPALIAAVTNAKGETVAIHRTWLAQNAVGKWVKADLRDAKMTLGRYVGGAIRLWRGDVVDPDTGEIKRAKSMKDAPHGSSVVISEGIEDALTIAIAAPEFRVLCAVSLANLGSLELPKNIKYVIIAADNDSEGSQATEALDRAVKHFQAQNRQVSIARAPEGHKDMNDLACSPDRPEKNNPDGEQGDE